MAQLRKYRDHLKSDGAGYILFGVWGALKIFITVTMDSSFIEGIINNLDDSAEEENPLLVKIILMIFMAILAVITLSVHYSIGVNAIKYSSGRKRSRRFLVAVFFLIIITFMGIRSYFREPDPDYEADGMDSIFASILVDLTSAYLLMDMLYSIFRMKRLEKKLNEKGRCDSIAG